MITPNKIQSLSILILPLPSMNFSYCSVQISWVSMSGSFFGGGSFSFLYVNLSLCKIARIPVHEYSHPPRLPVETAVPLSGMLGYPYILHAAAGRFRQIGTYQHPIAAFRYPEDEPH